LEVQYLEALLVRAALQDDGPHNPLARQLLDDLCRE
jgi:hypothetical protein